MAAETKERRSEECGNAAPDWKWKQQDVLIPLNLAERRYTGVAVLALPDESSFKLPAQGLFGRCLLVVAKYPPRYYGVHFANANIQVAQKPHEGI